MLHSNKEHRLPIKRYLLEALASQMISSYEEIECMIQDMINVYELFETDWNYFWSNRVISNMQKMQEIKEKRKIAGSKWCIARMEKVAFAKQKVAKEKKIKENKAETISSKEDTIFISEFSEKFQEAYKAWLDDRKKRKKPVTERAQELQLKRCREWWEAKAIKIIETAIEKSWTWLEDYWEKKSWWYQKQEKKSLTQMFEENPNFF